MTVGGATKCIKFWQWIVLAIIFGFIFGLAGKVSPVFGIIGSLVGSALFFWWLASLAIIRDDCHYVGEELSRKEQNRRLYGNEN